MDFFVTFSKIDEYPVLDNEIQQATLPKISD